MRECLQRRLPDSRFKRQGDPKRLPCAPSYAVPGSALGAGNVRELPEMIAGSAARPQRGYPSGVVRRPKPLPQCQPIRIAASKGPAMQGPGCGRHLHGHATGGSTTRTNRYFWLEPISHLLVSHSASSVVPGYVLHYRPDDQRRERVAVPELARESLPNLGSNRVGYRSRSEGRTLISAQ